MRVVAFGTRKLVNLGKSLYLYMRLVRIMASTVDDDGGEELETCFFSFLDIFYISEKVNYLQVQPAFISIFRIGEASSEAQSKLY